LELPAGEAHRGGCGKENFTPARTGEAAPEPQGPLKFSRSRPMSAAGKSWRELLPYFCRYKSRKETRNNEQLAISRQLLAFSIRRFEILDFRF